MTLLVLLALTASPDAGAVSEKNPGGLTRAAITKVVRKHQDELRMCGRGGGFTLEMTFVVNSEGRVRDIKTEAINVTDSSDIVTCVQVALRSWTFPSPGSKSVTVSHYQFVVPEK